MRDCGGLFDIDTRLVFHQKRIPAAPTNSDNVSVIQQTELAFVIINTSRSLGAVRRTVKNLVDHGPHDRQACCHDGDTVLDDGPHRSKRVGPEAVGEGDGLDVRNADDGDDHDEDAEEEDSGELKLPAGVCLEAPDVGHRQDEYGGVSQDVDAADDDQIDVQVDTLCGDGCVPVGLDGDALEDVCKDGREAVGGNEDAHRNAYPLESPAGKYPMV